MQEKGATWEENPSFHITGCCEVVGKMQEIRKDQGISSLQG